MSPISPNLLVYRVQESGIFLLYTYAVLLKILFALIDLLELKDLSNKIIVWLN